MKADSTGVGSVQLAMITTAIGVGVSLVLWYWPKAAPVKPFVGPIPYGPDTMIGTPPLTKEFYVDGARFTSMRTRRPMGGGVLCTDHSLTSARPDSSFCLVGAAEGFSFIEDPCFLVDSRSVVCANGDPGEFKRYETLGEIPTAPDAPTIADSAEVWPWAVQLRSGTTCTWRYSNETGIIRLPERSKPADYACGPGKPRAFFAVTKTGPNGKLRPIKELLVYNPKVSPPGSLVDLEKNAEGLWTGKYAPARSDVYRTVQLAAVWF